MASTPKLLTPVVVSSAGTAVQISATSLLVGAVMIQADPSNSGNIFVGDSSVASTNGIVVAPGSALPFDPQVLRANDEFFDLSQIYIDAATNGDFVRVIYYARK